MTIGSLVLFCTHTGDAWMLDPDDHFALHLAQGGQKLPYRILRSQGKFAVEWPAAYDIDGDTFLISERTGKARTILGYPTREIAQAIARAGRTS